MANAANLIPTLTFKSWLSNGTPNAFGTLTTYQAGTTTPIATWTDWTAVTSNPNPITLNSRGEANVYLIPNVAYKFVEADSAGNQIATTDQVINNQIITLYGGVDSGIANAYVLNFTASFSSYQSGIVIYWQASNSNTGPSTLNVNGLGAAPIVNPNGSPLSAGQIVGGTIITVIMVNGSWQLLNFTSGVGLGIFGPETTIASASTTDLGTAIAHTVNVTGGATITSLGASAQLTAPIYCVRFASNPVIIQSGSLATPSGANISVEAGDAMIAQYLGGGSWQILIYQSESAAILAGKSIATQRANTTVVSPDPDLAITINNPGTYVIEGWLNDISGTSSGGLSGQIAFTGSVVSGGWAADGVGAGVITAALTPINTTAELQSGQSGLASINLNGFLQCSNAGVLSFNWAQHSSNATASLVATGSFLRASRLSPSTSSFQPITHTYTSGAATETIPVGANTMVIEDWGGSAAGGAGSEYFVGKFPNFTGGGGGGSGAYCRSSFSVTGLPGQTITWAVGAAATVSTVAGGSFSMTTMTAPGGNAGGAASGAIGGIGGTGASAATGGTLINSAGTAGTAGAPGSFGIGGAGIVGINGTGAQGGNGGYGAGAPGKPGSNGLIIFRYT